MSDKPVAITPTAKHDSSAVLQEVVHQTRLSSQRDRSDVQDDLSYPATDKKAQSLAQRTASVDQQILALAQAGKPIPPDLKKAAMALHGQSSTDDRRDRDADYPAITKDHGDEKKEQAAIKADQALLKSPNLSPELRRQLQADIASKTQLIGNQRGDAVNEAAYAGHDVADLNANDRVTKALRGNTADLIPALQASIASKGPVAHDRGQDAVLEQKYAADDQSDEAHNARLNAALRHNPFIGKPS